MPQARNWMFLSVWTMLPPDTSKALFHTLVSLYEYTIFARRFCQFSLLITFEPGTSITFIHFPPEHLLFCLPSIPPNKNMSSEKTILSAESQNSRMVAGTWLAFSKYLLKVEFFDVWISWFLNMAWMCKNLFISYKLLIRNLKSCSNTMVLIIKNVMNGRNKYYGT